MAQNRIRRWVQAAAAVAAGSAALVAAVIFLLRPLHTQPRPLERAPESEILHDEPEAETQAQPPAAEAALPEVRHARAELASLESAPDESDVMAQLRQLMFKDPATSLRIARDGNRRFADSPDAAERAWFETRVLVRLGRFDEARQVARLMVERYPGTDWTIDVRRHLLSHPVGGSMP